MEKLNSLRQVFSFLLARCFMLYLAGAVLLVSLVNERVLASKTLDFFPRIPIYMMLFARGETGYEPVRFQEGIRYYKNLLVMHPDSATVYSALGFCYYQIENYRKAIPYMKKAASLGNDLFGLHYNLGMAYLKAGDTARALESFSNALKTPPQTTFVYPGMINPYQRLASGVYDGSQIARKPALQKSYQKCEELMAAGSNRKGGTRREALEAVLPHDDLYFYPSVRAIVVKGKKRYVPM